MNPQTSPSFQCKMLWLHSFLVISEFMQYSDIPPGHERRVLGGIKSVVMLPHKGHGLMVECEVRPSFQQQE